LATIYANSVFFSNEEDEAIYHLSKFRCGGQEAFTIYMTTFIHLFAFRLYGVKYQWSIGSTCQVTAISYVLTLYSGT